MTNLTPMRQSVIIPLPAVAVIDIAHPEYALLQMGDTHLLDVGLLCYSVRDPARVFRKGKARWVDESSFLPHRRELIRRLIGYFQDQLQAAALRPSTVRTRGVMFVYGFMTWADSMGYTAATEDPVSARRAMRAYVDHLRDQAARTLMTENSAARFQNEVANVLAALVGLTTTELTRGVRVLSLTRAAAVSTEPPEEGAQSRVLALCWSVFDGLTDFAIKGLPYPYKLSVPTYLTYPDDVLWIFPVVRWCKVPANQEEKTGVGARNFWAYRYDEGRLATPDEIRHHYRESDSANLAVKLAKSLLVEANNNERHSTRLIRAAAASQSFLILFIAHTGMNLQNALDLAWGDAFEVTPERQGFRTVKWRAGGKKVSFEIQPKFLPAFKKYLKLRDYLLDGQSCELLFFSTGANRAEAPHKWGGTQLPGFFKMLRQIDPTLPYISPRQWRAALSDWAVRNHDVSTAARLLQNSEVTVLQQYVSGTNAAHLAEMGAFLSKVEDVVLAKANAMADSTPLATGVCLKYGQPRALEGDTAPVSPDCKRPEGCLFCDKYRVHADEKDVRKLLSCRFCLVSMSKHAANQEQYDRLFGRVFARIDALLAAIEERDAAIVNTIRKEVDEGELDPYWASKFEMLQELELV